MEVYANGKDLQVILEDEASCKKRYGPEMSKKLKLRLAALRAAESLATFWPPNSGPERCHELKGGLQGTFSMDVKQPYRLLFKPFETDPPKDRSDEQARWLSIKAVTLTAVEDTHG